MKMYNSDARFSPFFYEFEEVMMESFLNVEKGENGNIGKEFDYRNPKDCVDMNVYDLDFSGNVNKAMERFRTFVRENFAGWTSPFILKKI